MAQIVCLAVSRKHGHFCVAGIDMQRHAWVRPISDRHDGAIPETMMALPGGQKPALLDILEIPLAGRQVLGEFQPENWHLRDEAWRKAGRAEVSFLTRYAGLSRTVLHNYADRVSPSDLKVLPRANRTSLQLVESSNARFFQDPKNSHAWRVCFTNFGHEYDLRVTDPVVEDSLSAGQSVSSRCFLTVSLTEPWRCSSDMEPFCYKLIAGVVERENARLGGPLEGFPSPMSMAEFLSGILTERSPFCAA